MGNDTMGKVLVEAKLENVIDLYQARSGVITDEQVRRLVIDDALVDTGATTLSMPRRMIQQLGLESLRTRQARTSAGIVTVGMFGPVRLTIDGRDCSLDVTELPDDCPVLIGQIPLELLDFIVDPRNHRLIGNPEHGGEHIIELY
ncbi:retroviral-like aspartic protease family protein [Tundrisphaera lichenicola]|uniref:retroviral-like aspartic protease family protein n=1 Tax=Tundrisphaera lichenicola TaxID=2029860 RepID=UPI003EB8BB62